MFKYLVILSLYANLGFASGTTKLVDYIVSGSGVVELLTKNGIKSADAQQVKSYVGSALAALGAKKSINKR